MGDSSKQDAGTNQRLAIGCPNQRLLRALDDMKNFDQGERLDEHDTEFVKRVLEDADTVKKLVAKHPESQPIVARSIGLYGERSRKGARKQHGRNEDRNMKEAETEQRCRREKGALRARRTRRKLERLHVELVKLAGVGQVTRA